MSAWRGGRHAGGRESPLRTWWPAAVVLVLVIAIFGARWFATRPRTVELGTTVTSSGLAVTVRGWGPADTGQLPAEPPATGTTSAAAIESCRTQEGGQIADLSRFRAELPGGERIEPSGSRMGPPEGDCVRGSILFALPEGASPTAIAFEGSPTVRWLLAAGD